MAVRQGHPVMDAVSDDAVETGKHRLLSASGKRDNVLAQDGGTKLGVEGFDLDRGPL